MFFTHHPRIALSAATLIAALMLITDGAGSRARADGRLTARYKISVAGIAIGRSEVNVAIGETDYTATANGRASGVLRILVSGEGSLATRGTLIDGRPIPASFVSSTTHDDEKAEVKMTLDGGAVKELSAETSAPAADRVAITEEHRKGIVDPMTALLVAVAGGELLVPAACQRTLPIFDGRRRYDLKLAFKRIDTVKSEKGYSGPAVVCAVTFHAIAGHRASSALVKYLADGRDIELALAPIAGTRVLAPFRLSVANMLGNMVIEAAEFETTPTMSIRAALPANATAQ